MYKVLHTEFHTSSALHFKVIVFTHTHRLLVDAYLILIYNFDIEGRILNFIQFIGFWSCVHTYLHRLTDRLPVDEFIPRFDTDLQL